MVMLPVTLNFVSAYLTPRNVGVAVVVLLAVTIVVALLLLRTTSRDSREFAFTMFRYSLLLPTLILWCCLMAGAFHYIRQANGTATPSDTYVVDSSQLSSVIESKYGLKVYPEPETQSSDWKEMPFKVRVQNTVQTCRFVPEGPITAEGQPASLVCNDKVMTPTAGK